MIKISQEVYTKIKSSGIAMVIEVCTMELLEYILRMDGVISMEGKLPGGRTYLKVDGGHHIEHEEYGCKKMQNKSLG